MNDPHLDMPGLNYLSGWIRAIPARIETLDNSKLDELLAFADALKSDAILECTNLWRNPKNADARPENFGSWKEAEALEGIIRVEQERRATVLPPAQVAPAERPATGRRNKPTQIQYALYYKFLQKAGLYHEFDGKNGKTKKEMCVEIGERHDISGEKFEKVYNSQSTSKADARNLKAVISMLTEAGHLAAKERAEDQLIIAEGRTPKGDP